MSDYINDPTAAPPLAELFPGRQVVDLYPEPDRMAEEARQSR